MAAQGNCDDAAEYFEKIEMKGIETGMAASEEAVLTALVHLKNGPINDAVALFAERFRFRDLGIGLVFDDKEGLTEFFQRAQKPYLDSFLQTDAILVKGNHVITQRTLHSRFAESCCGRASREVRLALHGASIAQTENGKIVEWADYYDGLTSRRAILSEYFIKNALCVGVQRRDR
jgi:limonene-1,2-epoxide hydrolase